MSSSEKGPSIEDLVRALEIESPQSVVSPSETTDSPPLKRKRPVEDASNESPAEPTAILDREPKRKPKTWDRSFINSNQRAGTMSISPRKSPAKERTLPTIPEGDPMDESSESHRTSPDIEMLDRSSASESVTTASSVKPVPSDEEEEDGTIHPRKDKGKAAARSVSTLRPLYQLCQCQYCMEQMKEGQCLRLIVGPETVCRPCAYGCYVGDHPDAN